MGSERCRGRLNTIIGEAEGWEGGGWGGGGGRGGGAGARMGGSTRKQGPT